MIKKIILSVFVISLISCGSENSNKEKTELLKEYKNQYSELKEKIKILEEEISSTDSIEHKLVKIGVKSISKELFEHYFEAAGSVEAVNDAYVSPETPGQIKRVHVKEGMRVEKGDLLISLNATIIKNSIAEIENALDLAKIVFNKQEKLWNQKIGSEIQFLQTKNNKESLEKKLKTINAQLEQTRIKAPFSGIIEEIFSKEGELASPGMRLIHLVNLKSVYINADVSEAYISKLNKNDDVKVTFPSYPDIEIHSEIHRTGNVVKSANRTFIVQIKIDNKDELLKPNIISIITLKDYSNDSAICVPSIILKKDIIGNYLYVAESKNDKTISKKRYVTTGISNDQNTVITSGLKEDENVITTGYNLIVNGTEVEIN